MESEILIPLIFAGLFLAVDIAMFIKMVFLLKKNKDCTVENLGNRLNPYLYATAALSILMAICMIIITVVK